MGWLDFFIGKDFSREKFPLADIKASFEFLISEFGFKLIAEEKREDFKAKYFLVYRSEISEMQVEICTDTARFYCVIRRIINGQPAKYSDRSNCIGFESLAVLENNGRHDYFEYLAGGKLSLEEVLDKTVRLFKRHKSFFTTNTWIDTDKIQQLIDDDFQKNYGYRPNNKPTFWDELRRQATAFFTENGYTILLDSDELPHFHQDSLLNQLIVAKDARQIKIRQADWRDDFFNYQVIVNSKMVYEIDTRYQSTDQCVEKLLVRLKQEIDKLS